MSIKRVCVVVALAAAGLGGCRAQQVGSARDVVSVDPVMAVVSSEHQGGPSLFAGDRLAFMMLASGSYGPTPGLDFPVAIDRYSMTIPAPRSSLVTVALY